MRKKLRVGFGREPTNQPGSSTLEKIFLLVVNDNSLGSSRTQTGPAWAVWRPRPRLTHHNSTSETLHCRPAAEPTEAWWASRGPKDHINMRVLHSGSKAKDQQIPETMICRILGIMWFFGPLALSVVTSDLWL